MKIIIILGPAGSGKGTQTKLLVKKLGLEYFCTGDELRKRREEDDYTGKKLFDVMTRGLLVPNFILAVVLVSRLDRIKSRKNFKGIVFEGVPREWPQAEIFDQALKWYGWDKSVKIIHINISREESIGRLTKRRICRECGHLIPWINKYKTIKKCDKCGGELVSRNDDNVHTIGVRLEEFQKRTMPMINNYKSRGMVMDVNGEQSIEDVHEDIIKALGF